MAMAIVPCAGPARLSQSCAPAVSYPRHSPHARRQHESARARASSACSPRRIAGGVWGRGLAGTAASATSSTRASRCAATHGPPDVVVVGIDEETFARPRLQWPFPRSEHARAIRELAATPAPQAGRLRRAVLRAVAAATQDRALFAAADDPRVILGTDGRCARYGGPGDHATATGSGPRRDAWRFRAIPMSIWRREAADQRRARLCSSPRAAIPNAGDARDRLRRSDGTVADLVQRRRGRKFDPGERARQGRRSSARRRPRAATTTRAGLGTALLRPGDPRQRHPDRPRRLPAGGHRPRGRRHPAPRRRLRRAARDAARRPLGPLARRVDRRDGRARDPARRRAARVRRRLDRPARARRCSRWSSGRSARSR